MFLNKQKIVKIKYKNIENLFFYTCFVLKYQLVMSMRGNNLCLSFNMEKIYENANFQINENDKVGIVGVNGAGKTTLLKVILKKQELDSGNIMISKKKRIGYLPQEIIIENLEMTVFEYLMSARPIEQLNKQLEQLYVEVAQQQEKDQRKTLRKIGEIQEQLEYYDCYNCENILFELISHMNIDSDLLDMKLIDLSGGQKSKIAFAHLLYSSPEIMLLDEPTNHLDIDTRNFVINYLKKYHGMILTISHDIDFLDEITNKILYLDKMTHQMITYEGNYTVFMKKLTKEKEAKENLIKKQEKEEAELKEFILQYSNSSGKRKRIAQSREKLLAKKQKDRIQHDEIRKKVRFKIKPLREGSKIPIKVNNISFHYPNSKALYHNLSFLINNRERFLIVGENGVGKSTLLKLLIGELKPLEGNIWFGSKTDIAYYAQEQELLDGNKTILENIDQSGYSEKELRSLLGSFLFSGDEVFKKVSVLSPGEKARLALCKVMLKQGNLLLLDEPTNHLDPETQKIIGENFKEYEGSIILVSHNPAFVENIGIDRMLILPSGKIVNYSKETLEYYYQLNEKA